MLLQNFFVDLTIVKSTYLLYKKQLTGSEIAFLWLSSSLQRKTLPKLLFPIGVKLENVLIYW